jgi:hypothetical protein
MPRFQPRQISAKSLEGYRGVPGYSYNSWAAKSENHCSQGLKYHLEIPTAIAPISLQSSRSILPTTFLHAIGTTQQDKLYTP